MAHYEVEPKPAETEDFMERAFADGYVTETGTGIAHILPPPDPFLPESGEKKQTVIEKLKAYLNKFADMLSDDSAGFDVYRNKKLNRVEDDEASEDDSYPMAAEPLLPPDPD